MSGAGLVESGGHIAVIMRYFSIFRWAGRVQSVFDRHRGLPVVSL